jgi:putative oxidoreductase
MNSAPLNAGVLLLARILLGVFFVMSGWGKITGYAGTAAYMTMHGVPTILLPLVILTEFGGGLAIILGFFTRWVAVALAGFTLLAALMFHNDLGDMNQFINFMKNVTIAGGFLVLFTTGAGPLSVDQRLRTA